MKRDFSESTKEQMVNLITNTDSLYSEDINSVDLFAPVDSYDDDFILYRNEIYDEVQTANNYATTNYTDNLVGRLNQLVDEAKEIDYQHYTKVEEATANTVLGYIDDLNILADALSVKSLGKNKTDILEKLKYGNYSTIFDYKDRFNASVDTKLCDRLYNDIVTPQGINHGILREIMQGDFLTDTELQVVFSVINDEFLVVQKDDEGIIDDFDIRSDDFEKFLQYCYIATPYNDDGADLVNYKLSGAYNDLVYYYNMYSCYITQTNNPKMVEEKYKDRVNMNGILYGINQYYNNIVLNSLCLDDSSKWVNNPLKISIDFCKAETYDFISVSYNSGNAKIEIYEYNNLNQTLAESDEKKAKEKIKDPEQVYVDTKWMEYMNYFKSYVAEYIPSERIAMFTDLLEIDKAATAAYNAQVEKNEQAQATVEKERYKKFVADASGIDQPAYGTVIQYSEKYTVLNQTVDIVELNKDLSIYNATVEEDEQITVEDVLSTLYEPSEEKIRNLNGYMKYTK